MSSRDEWLYRVPDTVTPDGTMPGFYAVASSPESRRELESMGGRLSDDWTDYERELQEDAGRDL